MENSQQKRVRNFPELRMPLCVLKGKKGEEEALGSVAGSRG